MTSSRSSSRNSIGGIEGGKAFPISSGMSLSHWLQSVRSSPLLDYRSTQDLPTTADVVIVGSGMSGTFIAYELLRQPNPPSKVVVLEAREFCSGATGRNSGHCKPDQYRGFVKYAKLFGEEQAKKLLDHEFKTWSKLVEFVEKAKVDCDLWVGDTFDVAMSPEVARDVVAAFDAYKAYGEKSAYGGKVDHINYISDPAEAEKVSRLKGALAIWSWKASTLFPWKLVAHIMQLCLDKGLHLQTWTPVSSVTTSGNRMWSVHTPRGVIPAPTVVYATNAYTSALLPSFARYIQPTAHMCDKVVPPRAYAGGHALQNSYAVILPAQLGAYTINPRCSADGIVLFDGWDLGRGKLEKYLDEDPRRLFDDSLNGFPAVTEAINELTSTALAGWSEGENAAGVGPVYAWSGIIGLIADTLPFVGAIPDSPGQWVCAGFHGHGMAHIFSCAPGLVTLMQGGSWAETELPECLQLTPERLGRIERKGLHFQP
ncbi:DAO-domain-containing protein [Roridomyces roridus]|uniref:DAO-domain-containing protein n=1 Tax=Roridomyces roridus TaxID=1738132 RepID=A0AAD7FDU8_9AGAR|nr:DAO-domain-containing protein [Roridomyces roridus]